MTMNVVLGHGEMPIRELTASLDDLRQRASEDGDNFWFLLEGRAEPNATDKALVSWLEDNEVWYAVISDGTDIDSVYQPEESHTAKRLAPAIVKQMQEAPEEGETAQLLALFASDDFTAEEDRWLNDVGAAVQAAGFVVRALNDGLVEIDMSDVEEVEGEPEEPVDEPVEEEAEGQTLAEKLDEMNREELIAFAQGMDITFPPRTRVSTMISTILAANIPQEAEAAAEETLEVEALASVSNLFTKTTSLSAPAMIIIISNGIVTARITSAETAEALVNA